MPTVNPNLELLKVEFREFCTSLYKNQIHDIFTSAGFNRVEPTPCISGERRSLVSDYYASVNWELTETVYKFLKVIEAVLLIDRLNVSKESKDSLRSLCNKCGFEVDSNGFTIHLTTKGVAQPVKNLIFAANGPKPEIIISDSVSNEIKIIKNEEYCLVYDQPIKTHGLLWKEVVQWWKHLTNTDNLDDKNAGRNLYKRLIESLSNNECEKLLFKTYYKEFYDKLNDKLPALIPQVYLHYDPYTIYQLQGHKRILRQRMDFLILLSNSIRIVIEVDGKQHYSEDNIAKPKLYTEMVAEDRKLKLAGYEVYRFGGYELQKEDAEDLVKQFFIALFRKHKIIT
jgi:very-short-patch-repair endonuclease